MGAVSFRKLGKSYGALRIVEDIDLEIADGEFVVLVGPSGCGKSTTLRMLAGLESITSGEVRIGDTMVNDLQPRERDIAMVFQDYVLYPHKTVRDNLGFSLKVRGVERSEAVRLIDEAATMLGISHLLDRRPGQLSGGQRQRVAMGWAIVRRPQVFLFDEPLSNLDAQLRGQVRTEIKKLHQALKTTIIYVTHDQVEAMTLADRIVILRGGIIEQVGTPDEVYNTPTNVFVGSFIGAPAMNFVRGRMQGGVAHWLLKTALTCARAAPTGCLMSRSEMGADMSVILLIRRCWPFWWTGQPKVRSRIDLLWACRDLHPDDHRHLSIEGPSQDVAHDVMLSTGWRMLSHPPLVRTGRVADATASAIPRVAPWPPSAQTGPIMKGRRE
ncbi:ATP-binding cassette domain-containing protein [Paracoccus sp. S3-43]|uniref:ABC transporter ATP-binding protein n=1 Tax=Paracoccus sp. S3-43 TaxID=3030011 RepID=UPI0023B0A16C|nr:ATP-binding cassette domain-containing protein [Paracoccus sp. S3-43]WEF24800.1 ATP-binding cassette domain-containing protein [Paracoccus sp. S3-43]